MKPIAVIDLETDPFKAFRSPKPFLAGYFDGKRTRTFWGKNCVAECWKAVRRELRGYYIYWHNGGKFDARYFMPHLKQAGATLFPIKGRMARFTLPDGTEFRDSFCLLPVSLKATGEKLDIDYKKLERHCREKHKEEIITYWKQDLKVLYDKVQEFVQTYGFGMTMAGRTFDQLKRNFALNPPKATEYHDRDFRRFYYGGRVEFFKLGRVPGNFCLIDINSAYPHAMLKKHAFGLKCIATESLPKNEETLQTCFVRFVGRCTGGLPVRAADGSLSFGAHDGEFFVTGWELVAARRAGVVEVREVLECLRPTDCRDFSRFVNHFYRQKKEAKKGSSEELFAKLFLNSAYGRFALNPREFRDVVMTDYREEPEENHDTRNKIAKLVETRHPGIRGESFDEKCREYWNGYAHKWTLANDFEDIGVSIWERPCEVRSNGFFNVATAASITGCVRAFLFESLRKCDNPIYCDTDSIVCEHPGALALGRELGEWKLECQFHPDSVWIAGKKLYAGKLAKAYWKKDKDGNYLPEEKQFKYASKGVKLSPQEIIRVAEGETVKSTLIAPTFSIFTTRAVKGSKQDFITRTVRRDDLRKKRRITP